MKINVSFPATGCQKLFEVDDEKKMRSFYEKRMGHEVEADHLGEEWKGYILRIAGGNDKQGFPMKQGVLTNNRVRLLLSKGHSCYRPRRTGERKRKSVRGCIVDSNLSVLALVVVKKGNAEIPGLTDSTVPRKLGPKRASKIRKLFNLDKKDDVRRYVIKRPLPSKEGKKAKTKAPKIQRLITPSVLQHRRHKNALKRLHREKNKEEKTDYAKLLATRQKEARMKKREDIKRRRSSMRDSRSSATSAPAKPEPKTVVQKSTKAGGAKAAAMAKTKHGKAAATPVKATIKQAGAATAKAATAAAKAKQTLAKGKKQAPSKLSKPAPKTTGKAATKKSAGEKPVLAKTAQKKQAEKPTKGAASKSALSKKGEKPVAGKGAAPKLATAKKTTAAAPKKPAGDKAAPKKPAADKAATKKPAGAKPAPKKPAGDKPAPKKPAGDKPAPKKPAGDKPAPKKPAGDKPAPKKPAGDKPAPKKPAGDKPAPKKPAGDKPAPKKPAGDKPVPKKPAGDKPAPKKPAGDKPAPKKPAGDKPAPKKPAGDKPAPKKPAGDKPAPKKPAGAGGAKAAPKPKK